MEAQDQEHHQHNTEDRPSAHYHLSHSSLEDDRSQQQTARNPKRRSQSMPIATMSLEIWPKKATSRDLICIHAKAT